MRDHVTALFGLAVTGSGLFLGMWGLFAREQADQRAMLDFLYTRAFNGVPSTSSDSSARDTYVQRFAEKGKVGWVSLVFGVLLLSGGGYLAGLGLIGISRRSPMASGPPAKPAPGWFEEALERMERGEGPEGA